MELRTTRPSVGWITTYDYDFAGYLSLQCLLIVFAWFYGARRDSSQRPVYRTVSTPNFRILVGVWQTL